MKLETAFIYRGCVLSEKDLPKNAQLGEVMFDGLSTYAFDGDKWIKMDGASISEKPEPQKILPRICSQCGAPVNSYRNSCEYCGVRY